MSDARQMIDPDAVRSIADVLFWKVQLVPCNQPGNVRWHNVEFATNPFRLTWTEPTEAEVTVDTCNDALKDLLVGLPGNCQDRLLIR